ncbi:hypothetical protein NEUTE2DRAFT_125592 [Neurospora tetrasperma FGSC 2509]|nr:hypothetical protein NEUTE2DRAFT_125592 [Neurospora tetrasperma FGSC 2509]
MGSWLGVACGSEGFPPKSIPSTYFSSPTAPGKRDIEPHPPPHPHPTPCDLPSRPAVFHFPCLEGRLSDLQEFNLCTSWFPPFMCMSYKSWTSGSYTEFQEETFPSDLTSAEQDVITNSFDGSTNSLPSQEHGMRTVKTERTNETFLRVLSSHSSTDTICIHCSRYRYQQKAKTTQRTKVQGPDRPESRGSPRRAPPSFLRPPA